MQFLIRDLAGHSVQNDLYKTKNFEADKQMFNSRS